MMQAKMEKTEPAVESPAVKDGLTDWVLAVLEVRLRAPAGN